MRGRTGGDHGAASHASPICMPFGCSHVDATREKEEEGRAASGAHSRQEGAPIGPGGPPEGIGSGGRDVIGCPADPPSLDDEAGNGQAFADSVAAGTAGGVRRARLGDHACGGARQLQKLLHPM